MPIRAILVVLALLASSTAVHAHETHNPDACAILVYRDVFQNLLTDWKEAGQKPRSPRYVFAKTDPITVEVRFKKQKASPVVVEVVNTTTIEEHDVNCDYHGMVDDWYTYRLRSSEYIYLIGDPSAAPSGTHFRMTDEEVLNFRVKIMPDCKVDWMVDRGERSSGGAVFYGGQTGDRNVVRFQQWYENGDRDFGMVVADIPAAVDFINNAGSNPPSGGQGDLLHWASHGAYNGSLYDEGPQYYFHPLSEGQSWNKDLDYTVLAACNSLSNIAKWARSRAYSLRAIVTNKTLYYECVKAGTSSSTSTGPSGTGNNIVDGTVEWKEIPAPPSNNDPFSGFIAWLTMTTGSHNAHGIFGAKHPVAGDLMTQMTAFYGQLTGGGTYFQSYVNGMESGVKQPWAVIIDPVYQPDTFKAVQQDGYQGHVLIKSN